MPIYLGAHQVGECQRCGFKMIRKSLVEDGYVPGLLVCKDCYDAEHPQDYPALTRLEGMPKLRPAPAQEPMPNAPVLSGSLSLGIAHLSWTASDTNASLIDTYRLYRSERIDEDADWSEYALVYTFEVEYDDFGKPESVLAYNDNVPNDDYFYRYYIIGHAIEVGDSDPSNVLDFSPPTYQYLTSKIYPIDAIEAIDANGDFRQSQRVRPFAEANDFNGDFRAGVLREALKTYTLGKAEATDVNGDFRAGLLDEVLIRYQLGKVEATDMNGDFREGVLRDVLQLYTNGKVEAVDMNGNFMGGVVT